MIDPKLKKQTIKAELVPEIPNYILIRMLI